MIRTLPHDEWAPYFDRFSRNKDDAGRIDYTEIRVISPEIGAQRETSWVPLQGVTYDPKGDLLEIIVPGLDHLVTHPVEIHVDETGDVLERFEVIRDDGTREIIEIR
jgi:hypothetical protein